MWDIHRTFPAHDYFKSTGGEGQEMLYKISKVSIEFIFSAHFSHSLLQFKKKKNVKASLHIANKLSI